MADETRERGARGERGDRGERGERGTDSWMEYQRLVLKELSDLNDLCKELSREVRTLTTDVALLKFKMVLIGSAVSVAVTVLIQLFSRVLGRP